MDSKRRQERRSGIVIMGKLIGLIKPLFPIMVAAILLGTAGYLCAIFLTIFAGRAVLAGISGDAGWKMIFIAMGVMALMRGILHYLEQLPIFL